MAVLQKYNCLVYSFEGGRARRQVQAPTIEDAQRLLWDEGVRIVEIRLSRFRIPSLHVILPSFFKVRKSEVILLTRQLSTFVKVGVPMLEALAVLQEQTGSKELRTALQDMVVALGQGQPLSAAMKEHPRIFSRLYVDMVRAAEVSGNLDQVLGRIAEYMLRDDTAIRRIRSALIYPGIVLGLSVTVVTVLVTFVLPAFVHLFQEFNAELPLPTRMLLAIGRFAEAYRLQLLVGVFAAVLAPVLYVQTGPGKYMRDRLAVRIPYLGKIIQFAIIERFLRTLATMTRAGIPVTQMFSTVIDATGNLVYRDKLREVEREMVSGAGFAGPLQRTHLFPAMVIQMVRVGEETGTLDANLEEAAQYYATEIDFKTRAMIAVMEPGLVIFVGLIVAFVAISIISPMYGLIRVIK